MKFQVMMKDPDVLHDAIVDAVHADVEETDSLRGDDEREAVREVRIGKANEIARRWFKYDEYLTVEIDTDAETCTVLPAR